MNAVQEQVKELVGVELAAANEKFPPFHSMHEGWAVIMEELDELRDDVFCCKTTLRKFAWAKIKEDEYPKEDIEYVMKNAVNAACEAIQVAAMCQKFMEMENG